MDLLYLLVNQEESAVKIGVSYCPQSRAAQLNTPINLQRSLEIEFENGSANSVERMLYYLFREHKHVMPIGGGHTEWFKIELLEEIRGFLESQRSRLGIKEVRPFILARSSELNEVKNAKETSQNCQAGSSQPEEGTISRTLSKKLVAAAERNAGVLAKIQQIFQGLYAEQQILGILPPMIADHDGRIYIQREAYKAALEELWQCSITGPGCRSNIFPGGFSSSSLEFAEINVCRHMLSESLPESDEPFGARFWKKLPGAEQIREYMYSLITKIEAKDYEKLLRVREELQAESASFSDSLHRSLDVPWDTDPLIPA